MAAKKEWKWGYINPSGQLVIPARYDDAWPFSEGLAPVKIEWARGYINQSGEMVIEPRFEKAGPFINGIASVIEDGAIRFIDGKGNYVEESRDPVWELQSNKSTDDDLYNNYFEAGPFSDGLARVKKTASAKWGYINPDGKVIIKPSFKQAEDFHEGRAAVLIAVEPE